MADVHSHRTTSLDLQARVQRLEAFIAPVKQLWQDPELDAALSSFAGFCDLLGIGKVRDYLVAHRVHEVSDWSTLPLDEEGQAMQTELTERAKVSGSLQIRKGSLTWFYWAGSPASCHQSLPRLLY